MELRDLVFPLVPRTICITYMLSSPFARELPHLGDMVHQAWVICSAILVDLRFVCFRDYLGDISLIVLLYPILSDTLLYFLLQRFHLPSMVSVKLLCLLLGSGVV